MRHGWMMMLIVMAIGAMSFCGGCDTHNQVSLDPTGSVRQVTDPGNAATMTPEGAQAASFKGSPPTHAKVDAAGIWSTMGGPTGLMAWVNQDTQMFLQSPKDVTMRGVKFSPQAGTFEAEEMSLNLSDPLAQQVAAYAEAMSAIQGLTQTEATARIEQMRAAGSISASVADLLLRLVVPALDR